MKLQIVLNIKLQRNNGLVLVVKEIYLLIFFTHFIVLNYLSHIIQTQIHTQFVIFIRKCLNEWINIHTQKYRKYLILIKIRIVKNSNEHLVVIVLLMENNMHTYVYDWCL